jgi:hypothetical protein
MAASDRDGIEVAEGKLNHSTHASYLGRHASVASLSAIVGPHESFDAVAPSTSRLANYVAACGLRQHGRNTP